MKPKTNAENKKVLVGKNIFFLLLFLAFIFSGCRKKEIHHNIPLSTKTEKKTTQDSLSLNIIKKFNENNEGNIFTTNNYRLNYDASSNRFNLYKEDKEIGSTNFDGKEFDGVGYDVYLFENPNSTIRTLVFEALADIGTAWYYFVVLEKDKPITKFLLTEPRGNSDEASLDKFLSIKIVGEKYILKFDKSYLAKYSEIPTDFQTDKKYVYFITNISGTYKITNSTLGNELQPITEAEDLGNVIFQKKDGKLLIREDILKYIQKNTTASNNKYVLLLEKYVTYQIIHFYDNHDRQWTEEELIKMTAYAANTTDPLHKKFWRKSPENWHNGMWGNILGFCYTGYYDKIWNHLIKEFEKNNYYNLPNLKESVSYATEFDRFGPP